MEGERRRVGLLVLNWNGLVVLPLCLDSLTAAAAESRHEVTLLLFDNGSTDGSQAWVREAQADWEILESDMNLGFAGGMNRGIEALVGRGCEFVCVLNNDIEADAGLIDPLVEALTAQSHRGASAPRIHYHGRRDRIWYAGGSVSRLAKIARHQGIREKAVGRWLEPCDTGYLTGCCIMGKAEFWRTTGGFDTDFELYAEDVDLSLRARALGWRLRYEPAALLYHRVGFSSGGASAPAKLRAQRRAVSKLLRRHVPPVLRPLARLGWGFYVSFAALGALGRGEGRVLGSLFASLLPGRRKGDA